MTHQEYYARLSKVQNRMNIPVDIITITGFMNEKEKIKHLERYEKDYPETD